MRAVLYATLAKAEAAARLQALIGGDLTVVDTDAALSEAIADADALFIGDMLYVGKTPRRCMTAARS